MAVLSASDLATIREWISDKTPPTDDDLQTIYTRHPTLKGVVIAVLRGRLAVFQMAPASISIPGQVAQGTGSNITSLQTMLADLIRYDENLNLGITVKRLVRSRGTRQPDVPGWGRC